MIIKLIALIWAILIAVIIAIIVPICCVTVLLNGLILGDWCNGFWGMMGYWIRGGINIIKDVIRG